uniref:C2H2-type domain-containing protein n=1 Tax=Manihot esculenta TaxID=3983 RepID=A0A2C9VNN8_MANES
MRPERNPLDLNNLPDDYTRDSKQVLDASSSSGYRKKKSGAKDGKDECGKVYECRFCSLKFCKSQALGGHMNRHRQERETETLNRARQLVFSSDNLAAQGHLGCHPMAPGSYPSGIADPYRSVYPTRLFSGSSSGLLPPAPPQPPHQPYLYTSPSRLTPYPSQCSHQQPINDYYIGHVLNNNSSQSYPSHQSMTYNMVGQESNYTCIGAPSGGRVELGKELAGGAGSQHHLDPPSINRFQDGF